MKKALLLLGLIMAIFAAPTYAQQERNVCGVTHEHGLLIKERLLNNRKITPNFARTRGVTTYVPVKIHLVGKDDGTGHASPDRVLDMLCILNEGWESAEIQFYLKGDFNYIDNSFFYAHSGNNDAIANEMNGFRVNNAINVFVTNSAGSGSGTVGTTLAYFSPTVDCVLVRKASMLGESVLPHEMGHFFSLNHPFFGWESAAWNAADHGNPVLSPTSPGGIVPNELVDGTNCLGSGDGICDTPPDYLFGFHPSQNGGCGEFTGGAMDPNGDLIDPMENNTMSYFEGCDYEFTEEQMNAAKSDLEQPARAYVNPGTTPNLDVVNELAVATFPINGEETFYNAIELKWDPVPGATLYSIEIADDPSFPNTSLRRVVTSNSAFIGDYCTPNTTYYWRVRPFNEYSTCESAFGDNFQFETNAIASKVETVEGVNHWSLRPNPANSSEAIFVDVEALQAMDATVNMYSVTGQLISSSKQLFSIGNNIVELATNNLTTGLYMVSIETKTGVTTKRVVIR